MQPTNKKQPFPHADHWKQIEQENKLNFDDCVIDFFQTNDLLSVVEALQDAKAKDKQTQDKIDKTAAGLKSIWFKHHLHAQDQNDILTKINKAHA